jgi:hypothetical protein
VTIFACSWTIIHPNFPGVDTWSSSRKGLCVIAIFLPKVLASLSLIEYCEVRKSFKTIKKSTNGQWSMSQLFFVYMGGVDLEFDEGTENLGNECHDLFNEDNKALKVFQAALDGNGTILNSETISGDDIEKRTKTNYLGKALACVQASWLVAQIIGRAIAKLPITSLEIVTVAYVVCALVTYCCWWHKPQDAEVTITVNCRNLKRAEVLGQYCGEYDGSEREGSWERILLCVICSIFGAVHCIAWNFYFATFAESVIWKVAGVLTVVIPFAFASSFVNEGFQGRSLGAILFIALLSYIPLRLYLIIEPFIAFRSVPVGIFYTINWSSLIPHV